MTRMHVKIDQDSPEYALYAAVIDSISKHVNVWMCTPELTEAKLRQAICSALMAQTVHNFMLWGHNKEDFLQMAEEEWDMRKMKCN